MRPTAGIGSSVSPHDPYGKPGCALHIFPCSRANQRIDPQGTPRAGPPSRLGGAGGSPRTDQSNARPFSTGSSARSQQHGNHKVGQDPQAEHGRDGPGPQAGSRLPGCPSADRGSGQYPGDAEQQQPPADHEQPVALNCRHDTRQPPAAIRSGRPPPEIASYPSAWSCPWSPRPGPSTG